MIQDSLTPAVYIPSFSYLLLSSLPRCVGKGAIGRGCSRTVANGITTNNYYGIDQWTGRSGRVAACRSQFTLAKFGSPWFNRLTDRILFIARCFTRLTGMVLHLMI